MFNIGGEGQMMIGALGATIAVLVLAGQLPGFLILLIGLAVGTLSGGLWGFIPGFLKARTGTSPVSKNLVPIADVPPLIALPGIRLDFGFIVALIMAAIVSWLLFRTTVGFELRAAGFNLTAARYAGMSAGGSMILAMVLSGGLMGLGGSFMLLGTVGQLSLDLHGGIGFTAIALALLASLRPGGVVLAALLFGALTTGGKLMGIQSGIPFALLSFIMALVIMFVAAPGLIRSIWRVRVSKPAPEVAAASQPTGTL
jgi:simple sugar transport system permease protein